MLAASSAGPATTLQEVQVSAFFMLHNIHLALLLHCFYNHHFEDCILIPSNKHSVLELILNIFVNPSMGYLVCS